MGSIRCVRAISHGWLFAAISACSQTSSHPDAMDDILPPELAVSLIDQPRATCTGVAMDLDVRRGDHIAGLPATAFTYTLVTPIAGDAANTSTPIQNRCFAEEGLDGGLAYYSICIDGLAPATNYFLVVGLTTDAGAANPSFFFHTLSSDSCPVDGGMDTLDSDAAADAGIDVPPEDAATLDVTSIDATVTE